MSAQASGRRTAPGVGPLDGTGHPAALLREVARRAPVRLALPGAAVFGAVLGGGVLVTGPLEPTVDGEDALVTDLVHGRTPAWTAVSAVASGLGSTPVVIATTVLVAVLLRLAYRRWRESVTLVAAVTLQAVVFLAVSAVVDRPRPGVPHLDEAPPTSSYPSGHTGASTALCLGIAVVVASQLRHAALRVAVVVGLLAVPLVVAVARVYRGMHHPTDIAAGLLNGAVCVVVAALAYLRDAGRARDP